MSGSATPNWSIRLRIVSSAWETALSLIRAASLSRTRKANRPGCPFSLGI